MLSTKCNVNICGNLRFDCTSLCSTREPHINKKPRCRCAPWHTKTNERPLAVNRRWPELVEGRTPSRYFVVIKYCIDQSKHGMRLLSSGFIYMAVYNRKWTKSSGNFKSPACNFHLVAQPLQFLGDLLTVFPLDLDHAIFHRPAAAANLLQPGRQGFHVIFG